jgi:hypothetical protein
MDAASVFEGDDARYAAKPLRSNAIARMRCDRKDAYVESFPVFSAAFASQGFPHRLHDLRSPAGVSFSRHPDAAGMHGGGVLPGAERIAVRQYEYL